MEDRTDEKRDERIENAHGDETAPYLSSPFILNKIFERHNCFFELIGTFAAES